MKTILWTSKTLLNDMNKQKHQNKITNTHLKQRDIINYVKYSELNLNILQNLIKQC